MVSATMTTIASASNPNEGTGAWIACWGDLEYTDVAKDVIRGTEEELSGQLL